ncbi:MULTISPECIES: superoxide dismutase [Haloferax]|uniref:Superoxide dismutase n=2 Tax=Haloferax TaxID=2251 RepID=A0A6G1Z150_9EURY|nr:MULTISPECIES: superoxide dismutase [Haloferax]KAB1187598.1 superoxide dismutase [Haloferax sp. CBA1149]MRW80256.1 superoxide dismutase [Haloferax marinisediminis]
MSSKQDGDGRIDYNRRALLKALPIAGLAVVGTGTAAAKSAFPAVIPLPIGFQPEGIVTGLGTDFFVGSLAGGAIYRGDLRTGSGDVFVPPTGGPAVGLSHDARSNYLFVAGGPTGRASVYDADTGALVADYELQDSQFVNDVVVTRTAAYFTDSARPSLYRIPLGAGGDVPNQSAVEEIPLSGDFTSVAGFNANGIDAPPNGKYLIVVNTSTGLLYKVDPASGDATEIDLGGETVTAGDGILLAGRTLYVVRNQLNQIAVVTLDPDATAGEVVDVITNPLFDVPTTVTGFGNSLYAVNARFGTPPANAEYDVVRVSK